MEHPARQRSRPPEDSIPASGPEKIIGGDFHIYIIRRIHFSQSILYLWQRVIRVVNSEKFDIIRKIEIEWISVPDRNVRVKENQVKVLSDPVTVNMERCCGYTIARKAWEGTAKRWCVSQETCWKSMNSFRRKRFHRTICKPLGHIGMFWSYEMSAFKGGHFFCFWWESMHKYRT